MYRLYHKPCIIIKQIYRRFDTLPITESQLKGYKLIETPGAKKSFWSKVKFW